jgi:hypothetical protein
MRILASAVLITMTMLALPGLAQERMPRPPDARLYIIWPPDGQVIRGGRLWVRMGLKNMGIAPAGVEMEGTGHHHFLIDAELPLLDEPIPADNNHIHFGAGQTEARLLELPPGEHTLQLMLADHNHVAHDPPLISEKITITVAPY